MIDFEPNEEQALIIDTVRGFAQNEIREAARDADESRKLERIFTSEGGRQRWW